MGNTSAAESALPCSRPESLTLRPATSHATLIRNSGPDPLDNRGNVDTVIVTDCFGLVADGVGHHYDHTGPQADKRTAMAQIWTRFTEAQARWPRELSLEALDELVRGEVWSASEQFEQLGKSSSLSCCFLAQCDHGKFWAVCFSIADSVLVLFREGKALPLSSSSSWNMEVGGDVRGMEGSVHELHPGDVVIGLTDGCVDAMRVLGKGVPGSGDLAMAACCEGVQRTLSLFSALNEDLDSLLRALFEAALRLTRDGAIGSDDCCSFAMRI